MTTLSDQLIVRNMTKDDLKIALGWAADEGWNPGLDDVDNFYIADPEGFFIGELNGEAVSCISVIRYHEDFNFIGLYIVKPELRKQGLGLKTWTEAFKLIPEQSAALDAVLQQVSNYQKFGFQSTHSHLRYEGIITGKLDADVMDIKNLDFEQLCLYDRQYFPSDRQKFLTQWINQPHGQGYAIITNGQILGYGVIRQATKGLRIGPLFAENAPIAEKLFLSLASYSEGHPIYIDVPTLNQEAIALCESYQMQPMFECVRMNKGKIPHLNWHNVFGVTTLELG